MGETLGLPLNWSWMHKPSVFLAVCQCERGRGSCRSGPGLNDGAYNLCFARQWHCELWLVVLMLPCTGIRWEISVVGPPVHQVARMAESERREMDLERAWGKLNERREWMRGKENERTDRRDVVRVKENGRCMAGECIVLVNEDLGHCVPANL